LRARGPGALSRFSLLVVVATLPFSEPAWPQGGPPFRTDDPETPGNRQWEINIGFIGERDRADGSYETPNLDINYGLGDRIQLKYEVPLSIQELRGDSSQIAAGLGNSMMGVKWRFYETRTEAPRPGKPLKSKFSFAMSIYPQLALNNPTGSLRRGIVDATPQFLLPLEAKATIGPVRIVGEVGYWFTSKAGPDPVPNSWIRGLLVGHEFKSKTELYLDLHDELDVQGPERQSTLGIGGRQPIGMHGKMLFLGTVGRAIAVKTPTNGQPSWIAYFGVQLQLGRDNQP
jgi:hypothetical protein